ncbi:MAG TPA: intradiol ring-cleavage dioxygenase [Dehalococcoidia bacterium]|nr:intradiol ring-cleavage dioxygenase [Dehalococcoidia bacterium]
MPRKVEAGMDNDDETKGRILSRREMFGVLGGLGAAALIAACSGDDNEAAQPTATTAAERAAATATTTSGTGGASATALPSCIVIPDLTEGPYFVDEQLNRSDIRSDPGGGATREGVELTLTLNVLSVAGAACSPLSGAMVDIWHCDAVGAYSDVNAGGQGGSTVGQKWLRGLQISNESGQVKFTTIYPGWYQGRATHIHFKVRKDNEEFTSQFFFDDELSDEINDGVAPYTQKGSRGRVLNASDNIYRESNGMLTLNVQKSGNAYAATFDIGIQS